MIRRSKIKVRPAIRKAQPSSQGSTSSQTSTSKGSQESPKRDEKKGNEVIPTKETGVSNDPQHREERAIGQNSDNRPSHATRTAKENPVAGSDGSPSVASNNDDSKTDKVKGKPQMARRRKLVACPTMARKRQKTAQPNPKPEVKSSDLTSENSPTSVEAKLNNTDVEIPQVSQPAEACVSESVSEALTLPIPIPPQATPVENISEEIPSTNLITLKTVTTVSLAAEEGVENSNRSCNNSVNSMDVEEYTNTRLSSESDEHKTVTETANVSLVEYEKHPKKAKDNISKDKHDSSDAKSLSEHKKTDGPRGIVTKRTTSKSKVTSVTAKHRHSAMAKLKKLKESQEEGDDEWPELDQNVVSMSDLIFLNPPNKIGLKLGMNVERESVENTVVQKEKSPEPEPSTSTQEEAKEDAPLPVPQIRITEDGSVVIDEESLVLDTRRPPERKAHAVYEFGREGMVNQCSFLRRPHARPSRWNQQETDKFYKCLCVVGAEFSLMSAMFRGRGADDLRRKFKRERKVNPARVDNALMQQHLSKWTDDMFEPEEGCENNANVITGTKPPEETVK